MLYRLLFCYYFLLLAVGSHGQAPYKMKYLGSSQGLSNNSVRCIFQDSRGFVWLGTYDGLDRYDGYEFKILRNRINDSASLPYNYISAINEDDKGYLWIGTGQGAVTYNTITNAITPVYCVSYTTKRKERITAYITSIEKDAAGNMLLGTSGSGIIARLKNEPTAVQVPLKNEGIVNYSVLATHISKEKHTWVFVSGLGLHRYNDKTKQLDAVDTSVRNLSVNKMLTDEWGNLWLATSTGLFQYAIAQKMIIAGYTADNGKLAANYVSAISFDTPDKLWVGTDGGGIDILDIHSGRVINMDEGRRTGLLSAKTILTIFADGESRKWVGTNKGGVNVFDITGNQFNTISRGTAYPGLSNNFITAFFEDPGGNLWIGTDGGGINVWNSRRDHFTIYQRPFLSNNIISGITQDAEQDTWIATFGGGVNRLMKNGSIKHYRLINTDGYENKIVIRVYVDSENNLWATTYENGHLYLFNRAQDQFEAFDQGLGDLMSIKEDRNNTLWAGNAAQLVKIDRVNRKHRFYEIGKTVRSIYEDSKGHFWIGSEGGGLVLFDRKAGKTAARYSEEDGLSSNTVMNILEDNAGNLWISTSNGLNRFNYSTRKFNRFYEPDGLQDNQFSYRAALKLRSGELVFGGNNGFNIFDPSKVSVRTSFPRVVVTSLRINNKNISGNNDYKTDSNGNILFLSVPYNEAVLSMQFAALEYSVPDKIQYAYYLEGWDKDWNFSGNVRTVTYNNIREGTYRLRIKSTNAEGAWNTKETVIHIKVLPPWYRTWWAYGIYLLAAGSLIFIYLKYKTNQAKIKYELRLAKVNEEMRQAELESERMEKEVQRAALEKANAEFEREKAERETERVINEKEKEINQKRLSFFTHISHEFRTPLTMIINPVHDLISQYQGKEKEELRVIGMNATRLLSLTDQLLLFRKIEESAEGLTVGKLDFSRLCNTVYYYFKHEAKTRHIHYEIEGIEEPIYLYGDKNKIEIILYNLIANAFKYVANGGSIAIKTEKDERVIKTVISDTGSGIPEGTGDAIFERFYQAEGHVKLGFGIGLYLVKQFTNMHKGNISYHSSARGTVFTLDLLMGKEHFGTLPVSEELQDNTIASGLKAFDDEEGEAEAYIPEVPALKAAKAILIVDDDEEIVNYVASIFNEMYVVYKAGNGAAALDITRNKKPDLIISDITMPGMDGIALCKAIRNDSSISHLPVILLTAHTSKDIELKGTEEGADYYITKPFSRELLLARVNGLFKSRENLQQYFYNKVTLSGHAAEAPEVPAEYQELLDKCITVVEKHLDDNTFTIEKLAREMAMSHSYLYKRIKQISGQSVNSFIRFLRLRKAAEFLITTNDSVADVAYRVGFNDVKYFREQFTRLFKMKPADYVKQYRGKMTDRLRIDNQ